MEKDKWVAADEFCSYYQIEYSFISSLHQSGLIHIEKAEEGAFLSVDEIREVEKFARLHYDLEINLEGIEAIAHLLSRIKRMQLEIAALKNVQPTTLNNGINQGIHQSQVPK